MNLLELKTALAPRYMKHREFTELVRSIRESREWIEKGIENKYVRRRLYAILQSYKQKRNEEKTKQ